MARCASRPPRVARRFPLPSFPSSPLHERAPVASLSPGPVCHGNFHLSPPLPPPPSPPPPPRKATIASLPPAGPVSAGTGGRPAQCGEEGPGRVFLRRRKRAASGEGGPGPRANQRRPRPGQRAAAATGRPGLVASGGGERRRGPRPWTRAPPPPPPPPPQGPGSVSHNAAAARALHQSKQSKNVKKSRAMPKNTFVVIKLL